jgi:tetratricopeptide (TPR) repeat protein
MDEALQYIFRALVHFRSIFEIQWGEKDPYFIGVIRLRLGEIYLKISRYEESKNEFQQALDIFESASSRTSVDVAKVINGMGQLEALQSNFAEAVNLFSEALEISREVSADNVEDIEKRLKAAREGKSI